MKLKTVLMLIGLATLVGISAQPAMALRAVPTYTAVPLNSPDPQAGAMFGNHIDAVGDVNGDGVSDFAVSADRQTLTGAPPKTGAVFIFSGKTHELLRTIGNPDP